MRSSDDCLTPSVLAEPKGGWIINKPAGWLTREPSLPAADARVLTRWISETLGRPFLVHRLDRGTSGVVCVARDAATQSAWSRAFQERRANKGYEALAVGKPERGIFKVDAAIEGLKAVTQVEVRSRWPSARPQTFRATIRIASGRRHQIRRHLAGLGLPILGDTQYGGPERLEAPAVTFARTALHARWLELPGLGRWEAPWPADWLAWIAALDSQAKGAA